MAWTCEVSASASGCGHCQITVRRDDGSAAVHHVHESETAGPFTIEDEYALAVLSAKRVRALTGLALQALAGRVLVGSEATNVRSYDFLGPGAAITKTNIGTAYVNICPGLNGERILVDLAGASEFRLIGTVNFVGTGPFGLRVVRDADNAVVYEAASIAQTGERELDSDWQPIPITVGALVLLRVQAKSAVGADDPVFRRLSMLVR